MWDFIESEKETHAVGLGIQIFMGLVGAFTLLIAVSASRISCTSW